MNITDPRPVHTTAPEVIRAAYGQVSAGGAHAVEQNYTQTALGQPGPQISTANPYTKDEL